MTRSQYELTSGREVIRVLFGARVGGQHPVRVDVRVVAATHRNVESLVRHGHFREDLYYRLRGGEIELPPLRERREDIANLDPKTGATWEGNYMGGRPFTQQSDN